MARPTGFKHSFVALHSIPYTPEGGADVRGDLHSSSLGSGQVVWTEHLHQRQPARVTAFVDAVGLVSLDPCWLVTPELYQAVNR